MNDNIEFEKHFFRPVCNEQEIERIFNVKNANDYLLKLRAETIVDHMRLFRAGGAYMPPLGMYATIAPRDACATRPVNRSFHPANAGLHQ